MIGLATVIPPRIDEKRRIRAAEWIRIAHQDGRGGIAKRASHIVLNICSERQGSLVNLCGTRVPVGQIHHEFTRSRFDEIVTDVIVGA